MMDTAIMLLYTYIHVHSQILITSGTRQPVY